MAEALRDGVRNKYVVDIGGTKVDVSKVWDTKDCIKDLITALNKSSFDEKRFQRVCLEKFPPTVYCVVINKPAKVCFLRHIEDWKLCKVGLTTVDANPYKKENGTRNRTRMDDVIAGAVDKGHEGVKPIFSLPIDFFDSRSSFAVEKDVRQKMGYPVHPFLARCLELPIPTEWVLVPQVYLRKLMSKIDAIKKDDSSDVLSTALFYQKRGSYDDFLKEIKRTKRKPPELPYCLKLDSGWIKHR